MNNMSSAAAKADRVEAKGLVFPGRNRKLNFAIISCGGTIGMEPGENNGLLEPKKSIDSILNEVDLSGLAERMEVSPENKRELFKLDSANLNPEHWKQLINAIEELQDQSDGILIFHGTDTMAYSATAVGLVLATRIKVPVVFTGAQKPIGETGNDAKSNVERAFLILDKAAREGVRECIIFFGDEAYRAVNSIKNSEAAFKGFESPNVRPLYITDGLGIKSVGLPRTEKDVVASKDRIGFKLRNEFSRGIAMMQIIPGFDADTLMAIAERGTTKAIILISLGVGSIPSLQGEFDLVKPVQRIITELGKPIVVASPFVGGNTNLDVYEVSALAKKAGVIDAGKMTKEATLVKARLILAQSEFSQSIETFRKALVIDFAGETGIL